MRIHYKKASVIFLCGLFLTASVFGQNMFRKVNDFDGDGKADFAVTRNIGGYKYWFVWQSTNGFRVFQWGIADDENVAGDYDGDGKTDFAVFRQEPAGPNSTRYSSWIFGSQTGTRAVIRETNAYPNVVGYQQDFNGDGKTDVSWTIENNASYFIIFDNGSTIA